VIAKAFASNRRPNSGLANEVAEDVCAARTVRVTKTRRVDVFDNVTTPADPIHLRTPSVRSSASYHTICACFSNNATLSP
jgi:hypothetical protein